MKDINLLTAESSIFLKKIKSKDNIIKDDNCDGYLVEANEKEARKIIDFLKGSGKIIALFGGENDFNRRAIETLKINFLVSPERGNRGDSLRQKDSGLNHVVAKESAKKNISIIVDISEISKLSKEEKSDRIAEIIQNVKICRKAKCKIKIASLANENEKIINEYGRKSFGLILGMSTEQMRDAVEF